MTRTTADLLGQPSLSDLMTRFLANRSDAAPAAAVESAESEVELYEVASGFRVDVRGTWLDATAVLQSAPGSLPPDWAGLVSQPAAAFAVPMAAGNFPQRVKDLHPLLTRFNPAELRPSSEQGPAPGLNGLRTWMAREVKKRQPAATLLAAGVGRAVGEFEWADEVLADAEVFCAGEFRAAWENERAALLWQRGDCEAALAAWAAMSETSAALFNRGMALLFLDRPAEARAVLTRAVAALPESGGWNALATLYLAMAEIHGSK